MQCLMNQYEVMTCNGVSYWRGNPYLTGRRTEGAFQLDFIVLGAGGLLTMLWLAARFLFAYNFK
jgi:hypothetical protein